MCFGVGKGRVVWDVNFLGGGDGVVVDVVVVVIVEVDGGVVFLCLCLSERC